MRNTQHSVLLTGGAGYIGCVLTPKLLALGHKVTTFDCCLFEEGPLASFIDHPNFTLIKGDIRDHAHVSKTLEGGDFDTVIHLAAISNDPSSELDADLTRDVNLTAVDHIMKAAKVAGIKRFLYASSASVYGIKETPDVHEALPLEPITLYAKYKAEGETLLNALVDDDFVGVSVRAATVCGYSPRLRLDLTINILTGHAITNGRIRVFGGAQKRPNIHVDDLAEFYIHLMDADAGVVNGRAYNISIKNDTVLGLAEMIRDEVDASIPIDIVPTDDHRSYQLTAQRMVDELGFRPKYPLTEAIAELKAAFADGRVADPSQSHYRNVVWMKEHPDFWSFKND